MKKAFIGLAALLLSATAAMAQVSVKSNSGDLNLRLIGRTNLDYGRYFSHCDNLDYGFKMNDTRLGVLANFDEKWSAKVEICYANKAVSFRDLWIGYQINDKMWLKGGNHFQFFGAKTLGLAYKFIEDAQADYAICPSRKIGLSYTYCINPLLIQTGIFSDANVDALSGTSGIDQGYSLSAKFIGRPICSDSTVLHIGVAGMYTDVANAYSYTVNQPETFSATKLMSYTSVLDHTSNINRGEAELLFIHKRFYFETHFLKAFSNLDFDKNFETQGFYAQTGFLLIGNKQNYNKKTGLATNASPKNLEILARIDRLTMDESMTSKTTSASVIDNDKVVTKSTTVDVETPEQSVTDFTLGMNYFFNKYLNARLNYTVSKVDNGKDEHTNNAIQARLQFSF